ARERAPAAERLIEHRRHRELIRARRRARTPRFGRGVGTDAARVVPFGQKTRRATDANLDARRPERAVDRSLLVRRVEMHGEETRDLDHLVDLDGAALEPDVEPFGGVNRLAHTPSGKWHAT